METTSQINIDSKNLRAYSTGLLQGIAYRALNDHLTNVLLDFDLTIPEWKLLGQLCDHDKMSLDDLSKLLGVEPPLTTRIFTSLLERGLVLTSTNELDRRVKLASVSEKGRNLIDEIENPVKEKLSQLLEGTSREELLIYIKVLATIVNNSNKNTFNNSIAKGGE